jgi:hypothetical protein
MIVNLPDELVLMILNRCNARAIISCQRVSRKFKQLVESEVSLQQAIFGRFPRKIMVKILKDMVRIDRWNGQNRGGCPLLYPFEQLNSAYHRLLHQHHEIAPLLFRKGEVLHSMDGIGILHDNVDVHPVFNAISHVLYSPLHTIAYWRYYAYEDGIENFVDGKVADEFATIPPFSTIWIYVWDSRYDVENNLVVRNVGGVTVRDVMAKYCSIQRPEGCEESSYLLGGMDVKGTHDGQLELEAMLMT